MGKVICVTNQKGGVGKTTTTHNAGAGLARLGFKVLLIDFDPQGNLTSGVGLENPENTVYQALREGEGKMPLFKVSENLWIVPANRTLANFEKEMSGEPGPHTFLTELIEPYKPKLDVIIIDCPPTLNLLTINAMSASDFVLIPIHAQKYSEEGLFMTMDTLEKVRKRVNAKLKLGGIVFTRLIERRVLARSKKREIKRKYGDRVLDTFIRENVALQEAPDFGLDVFAYEEMKKEKTKWYFATSNGALDYEALVKELVTRLKLNSKN